MYRSDSKERTQNRRQERQFAGRVSSFAYVMELEREQQAHTRESLAEIRRVHKFHAGVR